MFDSATSDHIEDLLQRCRFPSPGTRLDCAVSGGADSLSLLVLAVAAGCDVEAFHVDHGLRSSSASEGRVVEAAAKRFGARFTGLTVHVAHGANLEARAREARYGALPGDVATGHTADDQAETVLLALLRGSAWQGLGAMQPGLRRPILGLRRRETLGLCARLGLDVVIDESNTDLSLRRNRVRHELLPLASGIADRDIVPVLVRQAALFRQGGELLAEQADGIDPTDAKALVDAPEVLARMAVRRWLWLERDDDHPPDLATVDRVLAVARLQARAAEVGKGWRVERTDQRLRLVDPASRPAPER